MVAAEKALPIVLLVPLAQPTLVAVEGAVIHLHMQMDTQAALES
jgi:hypothetical protein